MLAELELNENIKAEILRTGPLKDLTPITYPTSIIPPTAQGTILRFEMGT